MVSQYFRPVVKMGPKPGNTSIIEKVSEKFDGKSIF